MWNRITRVLNLRFVSIELVRIGGEKKNIKVDLRLSTLNRRSIGVDIRLNLVYIVKYRESYDKSAD